MRKNQTLKILYVSSTVCLIPTYKIETSLVDQNIIIRKKL